MKTVHIQLKGDTYNGLLYILQEGYKLLDEKRKKMENTLFDQPNLSNALKNLDEVKSNLDRISDVHFEILENVEKIYTPSVNNSKLTIDNE